MSTRWLGRVVVVVGVSAMAAGVGGCGGAMTPFEPEEGDFRVLMPGTPRVERSSTITPQGPQRIRDYQGRSGRTLYAVTVFERIDGQGDLIAWDAPEESLEQLAGRIVSTGLRVTNERPLTLDGKPGRAYQTASNEDGVRTDFRFLVSGPRLYMLSYEVPDSFYSEAKARAFFDSFAFGGGGSETGLASATGDAGRGSPSRPPPPPVVASSPIVRNEAQAEVEAMRSERSRMPRGPSPEEIGSASTAVSEAMGPIPGGPDAATLGRRGVPSRGAGGGPPGMGGGPPGVGGIAGFGPGGGPVPGRGAIPGPGEGPGAVRPSPAPAPGLGPGRAAGIGFETEMAGGSGGGSFRSVDPDRPLLGIDFRLGEWDGEKSLGRVTALFERDQRAPINTTREIAPEGYAVGGAEVRTIRFVNAIRFLYLRVAPDGRLDPSDRIEGEWIGVPPPDEAGRTVTLGGDGRTVIGLVCQQGAILDGLALVMDRPEP
ncbi:hypothetical protein AB1L88_26480 [Tautonia sp. JC769]|uniref:hypothetical protein n=1 Tax=Tautonia sp. JC769 TaxID=3232135 RepID=UPI00345A5B9F